MIKRVVLKERILHSFIQFYKGNTGEKSLGKKDSY